MGLARALNLGAILLRLEQCGRVGFASTGFALQAFSASTVVSVVRALSIITLAPGSIRLGKTFASEAKSAIRANWPMASLFSGVMWPGEVNSTGSPAAGT